MQQIIISVPDETALALKLTDEQLAAEVRLAAAAKLYELGRLSSGTAATLAGVSRVEFLSRLGEYGVDTFRLTAEEVQQETRLA